MSKKLTKLFSVLAFLSVAVLIVSMSSESAVESSGTSLGFAYKLSLLLRVNITNSAIRVFAHFTEYAVLGFTLANIFFVYRGFLSMIFPFVLGALFAFSDEIHQYFVPGRACQLSDAAVDCSGVLLGIAAYTVFVLILISISKKLRRKKHG